MGFNSGMASTSRSVVWPVVHEDRHALIQDLEAVSGRPVSESELSGPGAAVFLPGQW